MRRPLWSASNRMTGSWRGSPQPAASKAPHRPRPAHQATTFQELAVYKAGSLCRGWPRTSSTPGRTCRRGHAGAPETWCSSALHRLTATAARPHPGRNAALRVPAWVCGRPFVDVYEVDDNAGADHMTCSRRSPTRRSRRGSGTPRAPGEWPRALNSPGNGRCTALPQASAEPLSAGSDGLSPAWWNERHISMPGNEPVVSSSCSSRNQAASACLIASS
jgi:hypothetical protein